MQVTRITTDETFRSVLEYGCTNFPFACYLDEISNHKNKNIVWHWHREFEISYIVEGVVRCFVDDECIILSPGDALFINSEVIHHFEGDFGLMYNIVFSPELIAGNTPTVFQKSVLPYLESNCKYLLFPKTDAVYFELLAEIRDLGELSRTVTCNSELKQYSKVIQLWVQIADLTKDGLAPKKGTADMLRQARLRMMMQYIHSNYSFHISLSDIARQASISVSEALRCFKTGLKTTPINYLTEYRLEIAFSQLISTRNTIHQIALSVGFENTSYFCRKFKERYGCSPMVARKSGKCNSVINARTK